MFVTAAGNALRSLLTFPVPDPVGCAAKASFHNECLLSVVRSRIATQLPGGCTAFPAVRRLISRILLCPGADDWPLASLPEFLVDRPLCERFWNRVGPSLDRALEVQARMHSGSSEYTWECGINTEMLAPYVCLQDDEGDAFGKVQCGYVQVVWFSEHCRFYVVLSGTGRTEVMRQSFLIRFTPLGGGIGFKKRNTGNPPLPKFAGASTSGGADGGSGIKPGEAQAIDDGAGGVVPRWEPDLMFQAAELTYLLAAREAKKSVSSICDMYNWVGSWYAVAGSYDCRLFAGGNCG